jgi:hypothetical protein
MQTRIQFDQGFCPTNIGSDQLMPSDAVAGWLEEHQALLPKAKIKDGILTWKIGKGEDNKTVFGSATVTEHSDDFTNIPEPEETEEDD